MLAISKQDREAWMRGHLCSSQSNQMSQIDKDQEMECLPAADWAPVEQ